MRSWSSQATTVSRLISGNYTHKSAIVSSSRHLHAPSKNEVGSSTRRRRPSLVLGRHVREALLNNSPIVALESTVITHGLPEPRNLELALRLEDEIAKGYWWRDTANEEQQQQQPSSGYSGVVTPATIGIVNGQVVVGLSRDEIQYLACREKSQPIKASRRDIPIALAMGLSAGTTVSATMAIASSSSLMAIALSEAPVASSSMNGGHNYGNDWNLIGQHGRNRSRFIGGSPIRVFATGGMGGVHLGGEQSMDISADLYEFARSPIGLVSSGFKSFLDTRRSLEFLETLGCTVTSLVGFESTYQASEHMNVSSHSGHENNMDSHHSRQQQQHCGHPFPGFFSTINKERVQSPWQCANVKEAAEILFECLEASLWQQQHDHFHPEATAAQNDRLETSSPSSSSIPGFMGGDSRARAMLLACPIPEKSSLNLDEDLEYRRAMELVSSIDKRQDLAGNEKTPLILEQLNQSTGGKTLEANMELLRNNARIGAHLAYEYSLLRETNSARRTGAILPRTHHQEPQTGPSSPDLQQASSHQGTKNGRNNNSPVVIGCTMIDMHVSTEIDHQFKTNPRNSGVTFEGKPHLTLGGVGRNLACAIELLGHKPIFITSLARGDNLSDFALNELNKFNLNVDSARLKINWPNERQLSTCFALVLMDSISGQCEYVIANLRLNQFLTRDSLEDKQQLNALNEIVAAPLLVLDANLSSELIDFLIEFCNQHKVPIFMEPTDVVCLQRLAGCLSKRAASNQQQQANKSLAFLSPNVLELAELLASFEKLEGDNDSELKDLNNDFSEQQIEQMANKLMTNYLPDLKCLLVTMDKRGVFVFVRRQIDDRRDQVDHLRLLSELHRPTGCNILSKYYRTPELVENPISVSGAGDSFASGFISGLLNDLKLADCVQKGFKAAHLSLLDRDTIPQSLKEFH